LSSHEEEYEKNWKFDFGGGKFCLVYEDKFDFLGDSDDYSVKCSTLHGDFIFRCFNLTDEGDMFLRNVP
jgi:hypothetical protein